MIAHIQGGAVFVTGGTASFTSCEFTLNSASSSVRLRSPPPPALARAAAAAAHPPHPALTALARLHANQGAVLLVNTGGSTATFASTLPANSFSGNTGANNYGNCYKENRGTITGSCG